MRRFLTASVALGLLALTGCGGTGGDARAHSPGPTTLQPAAAAPAAGTRRVTCALRVDGSPVTVALDLPSDVRAKGACTWTRPDSRTGGRRITDVEEPTVVTVSPVGKDRADTAKGLYEDNEQFAVADDEFEGDDTLYDLVYRHDVPVLGATVGDTVSWNCYCDGAPELSYYAQAAGVQVLWSAAPDTRAQTEQELATALAGAGLVP